MKFPAFILVCSILILFNSADGGLVKDLLGKVHQSVETVHKDLKGIWRPDHENKTSNEDQDKVENKDVSSTTSLPVSPPKKEETDATTKAVDSNIDSDKNKEETVTQNTPGATEEVKQEEITTEKEGRENFKVGCPTGTRRAPNGHCKPTV